MCSNHTIPKGMMLFSNTFSVSVVTSVVLKRTQLADFRTLMRARRKCTTLKELYKLQGKY